MLILYTCDIEIIQNFISKIINLLSLLNHSLGDSVKNFTNRKKNVISTTQTETLDILLDSMHS